MMPHPQIRNRTRRFSPCNRHPSEPVTALCALCLRDRLAGLDSSSGQIEVEKVVVCSRRTRGHGAASSPELRRSKSVAVEVLSDLVVDPRRSSCDVRVRSTLSNLFVVEDKKKFHRNGFATVESVNLGFSGTDEGEEEDNDDDDEIRDSDYVIGRTEIDDDDEVIEGDLKTMKEIIDIELQNQRNLRNAASVFSEKLRKWREKQKEKKQSRCVNGGIENESSNLGQSSQFRDTQFEVTDYGFGRRSCDTEPRFSIDAHRLSVEDPRFSLDEHRASVVDKLMLAPVNKVRNSSGGSVQSNSEPSNLNRRSSSSSLTSSITKTEGIGGGDVKSASNARVSPASDDVIFQGTKLVITEKELRDWHLNSLKKKSIESVSNAPPDSISKTSLPNPSSPSSDQKKKVMISRWRKVCSLWGHKQKLDEKKNLEDIPENRNAKLVRNPSSTSSRNRRDAFVLDRNRSKRYSTSDLDSGLLRLHLAPFRNSRRKKSGKSRVPSIIGH
ncbi:hypothetical protein SSX86_022411 [Deinandra increscens subsp. villosa]|uniref:Uncharacterized protein n=1 Tax=Deinandra increscens subsp. villosa TaxID=3103831 RepID=A0AAP0CNZ7_9ASTR